MVLRNRTLWERKNIVFVEGVLGALSLSGCFPVLPISSAPCNFNSRPQSLGPPAYLGPSGPYFGVRSLFLSGFHLAPPLFFLPSPPGGPVFISGPFQPFQAPVLGALAFFWPFLFLAQLAVGGPFNPRRGRGSVGLTQPFSLLSCRCSPFHTLCQVHFACFRPC